MTDHPAGLTAAEVAARHADGRDNSDRAQASRSTGDIVRANVLTRFNAILGVLLVVILVVGPLQDALFGVVLVLNVLVGVAQELRAKWALDRLALLAAPRAKVIRDGRAEVVARDEVVEDDVLVLGRGDQVVADAVVLSATGLLVDESILTGEAEPVEPAPGDGLLAGSLVVAGSAFCRVTGVGAGSFASRLSAEARAFGLARSELRAGIDRILRVVTWLLVPAAALLVAAQLRTGERLDHAVRASVAAVGAMVPEGLVLLSSVAFAVGVIRLARRDVLVQELGALEGLARVDVLCLDKTGTLTDGRLEVVGVEVVDGRSLAEVEAALGAVAAHEPETTSTSIAIGDRFADPRWDVLGSVAFSSERKWSAVDAGPRGVWVLGAPDILLPRADPVGERVTTLTATGERVVLLAQVDRLDGQRVDGVVRPVALLRLRERLRHDAAHVVGWFADEGVRLVVLSGDHPGTAAAVARSAGVGHGPGIDASVLPEDGPGLASAVLEARVVGRVTPQQKRTIVQALQGAGHTVGMTGDGVNDVLALKTADLGVAMGAGSDAAKAVSRVVLLANDFSALPHVVHEGRRVIGNVERVANLFLTKTVYAFVLAIAVGIAGIPFPFFPRHLTVVSALTIGIPGFFLALASNARRADTDFVPRVLRFAAPAGVVVAVTTLVAYGVARRWDEPIAASRTIASVALFVVALWVLDLLARPLTPARIALLASSAGAFVTILTLPFTREFFALQLPDLATLEIAAGAAVLGAATLELGWRVSGWRYTEGPTSPSE